MNAFSSSRIVAAILLTTLTALGGCASEPEPAEATDSADLTSPALPGRWRSKVETPTMTVQLSLDDAAGSYELAVCADPTCAGMAKETESGTWKATSSSLELTPSAGRVRSIVSREFVYLVTGAEKKELLLETNQPLGLPETSPAPPASVHEAFRFQRIVESAPVLCGPVRCSEGTVCCNPLAGACVGPGELCLF